MSRITKNLSLAILASSLSIVANAAVIVVDQKTCTLTQAIEAANGDVPIGRCTAGKGADTIEIRAKVKLKSADDQQDALPPIVGKLVVNGHNNQILGINGGIGRFFHVTSGANLTLNEVWLRFGKYSGNDDVGGGAILNEAGGKLTVNRSTISENDSDLTPGGAISNFGDAIISNTTIVNNDGYYGGAIFSSSSDGQPHKLIMINSTVDGNAATIDGAFSIQGPVNVQFTHVTMTGNLATRGCGGYCSSNGARLSMQNSVMADSFSSNFFQPASDEFDCIPDTPATDLGGNLIEHDYSCFASSFSDSTDPKLSPMAMYGGPTPTHLPMGDSPLINASKCVVETDQRGSKRAKDACDTGAVGIYRPLDNLFLQFDKKLAKGKLQGIGKTEAEKTKHVKDYRNLLVSAMNGRIQKNKSLLCTSLKDAHLRLDRNGTIQSHEWINGKATKALTARIETAQGESKCIK